jgi:hypothetical protein
VPTSIDSAANPTNTQEDINLRCNRYFVAKEGVGCWKLAYEVGIELAQPSKWNSILGANGDDCGT